MVAERESIADCGSSTEPNSSHINDKIYIDEFGDRWYRTREGSRTSRIRFLRCWTCGQMGHVSRHCAHRRHHVDCAMEIKKVKNEMVEYGRLTFVNLNCHDKMFKDIDHEIENIKVNIGENDHKFEETINQRLTDFDDEITVKFTKMIDERIKDMMFKESHHDDMIKMINGRFENT